MRQFDDFEAVINEVEDDTGPNETLVTWLAHEPFRKDCLDRRLKRHHITGKKSCARLELHQ